MIPLLPPAPTMVSPRRLTTSDAPALIVMPSPEVTVIPASPPSSLTMLTAE